MTRYDPDIAAKLLADAGRWFRRMPPCWNGAQIAQPLYDPTNGALLGKALMGTGLLLAGDFPAYGIRAGTHLSHVFERSKVMYGHDLVAAVTNRLALPPEGHPFYRTLPGRFFSPQRAAVELARHGVALSRTVDAVKRLVAAITTYDGIINARAGGFANDPVMSKVSITTTAQFFYSLFRNGGLPVAGTYTNIPGGAVHTRASTGAWNGILSTTGGRKKYLLTFGYSSASSIDWGILVDLLVAAGNISASITTGQTINSTAETRNYAAGVGGGQGAGVMATFEVTTALGTGTGTFSMTSYTDQDGTAAHASGTGTSSASAIAQKLVPDGGNSPPPWLILASGDYGVRSVESFAFSAAHSAGVIALNLVFPLAYLPGLIGNVYIERDSTTQIDGLTELVQDGSNVVGCLTLFVQTNSTTSGSLKAWARTTEG